jgi:hypothetical protein
MCTCSTETSSPLASTASPAKASAPVEVSTHWFVSFRRARVKLWLHRLPDECQNGESRISSKYVTPAKI